MEIKNDLQTEDKRVPLKPEMFENGIDLTDKITIQKLNSSAGGTSITYWGKNKITGEKFIIKEIFPRESRILLERDINGYKVISNCRNQKAISDYRTNMYNHVIKENELTTKFYTSNDKNNNSELFFGTELIPTQDLNENFKDTEAIYILVHTHVGQTLSDILKENLDLRAALYYTKMILRPLNRIHELGYCHLDLKLDNTFLGTDFDDIYERHVKLLDFGTCLKIEEINEDTLFSKSPEFAPPEINVFYSQPSDYLEIVGIQSDLYQVGIMCLQMVLNSLFQDKTDEKYPIWKDFIKTTTQEKREKRIDELLHFVDCRYDYLVPSLKNFFVKCFYFNYTDVQTSKNNRFKNCTEMSNALDELIDAIDNKGISEVVLQRNTKAQYEYIARTYSNVDNLDDNKLKSFESIFEEALFPEYDVI